MAGIHDSISATASSKVNFSNLILRVFQILFAVAVVGFYASQYNSKLNKSLLEQGYSTLQHKLALGVTVGSLSIVTATAFALIPALISYYYVAVAFLWDFIICFIWCAVFAWFRYVSYLSQYRFDSNTSLASFNWVNVINLLLWLATALMSVICLMKDRKSLRFGGSGV